MREDDSQAGIFRGQHAFGDWRILNIFSWSFLRLFPAA